MKYIEEFANEVMSNATKDDENYKFDPILILTIISIIVGIIRLMISCNLFGKNAYTRMQNPGFIDNIMIKRVINQKTPKEFKHMKDQIKQAVLEESKKISSIKFDNMVHQVITNKEYK